MPWLRVGILTDAVPEPTASVIMTFLEKSVFVRLEEETCLQKSPNKRLSILEDQITIERTNIRRPEVKTVLQPMSLLQAGRQL